MYSPNYNSVILSDAVLRSLRLAVAMGVLESGIHEGE